MSFGLSRGRTLDPGEIAIPAEAIPSLPDDVLTNPRGAWIDPRTWFTDPTRPFEIEIGSGKGTFLVQQAGAEPNVNYLGIEYAREFFLYAADRLRRGAVTSARLLNIDAAEFLHWRVPDACARTIHLYFPDPWPKTRHHRRRMVQDRFLADAYRILLPGGELRIVTDHPEYWAWMEEHLTRWSTTTASAVAAGPIDGTCPVFERRAFNPPAWATDGELVGTNFERKYRLEGRPFHAATLVKPSR